MKKVLIALALGLVMVSLIATPAFAGSKPPVPPGTPGLGVQKAVIEAGGTNYGFAYFNLDNFYDTIRVTVSMKNLPLRDAGNNTLYYKVVVKVSWDGGSLTSAGGWLTPSAKGNVGDLRVINIYTWALPTVKTFEVYVEIHQTTDTSEYGPDWVWTTTATDEKTLVFS